MKPMSEAHFAILRRHMVEVIGIQVDLASEELGKAALDERVLAAMRKVPRHRFVPSFLAPLAYQCQPALNIDPRSASKIDPPVWWLVPVVHRGDPRDAECPSRG